MSFTDFKKHFNDFEICSVSVDQLYEDDAGRFVYNVQYGNVECGHLLIYGSSTA